MLHSLVYFALKKYKIFNCGSRKSGKKIFTFLCPTKMYNEGGER